MPDPVCWLYLALIILFVVLAAFFSMAETSFSCLNKYRFEVEAQEGRRLARKVLKIHERFDTTLVTVLVAINGLSVALSVLTTQLFLHLLPGMEDTLTSLLSSVVLTIVLYFFGETIPKQVARKIPNGCAAFCAYPLSFFIVILYPISILFRGIAFLSKKLFHSAKTPELTEEDFTTVIETNERHGLLEENESDLIQASFDFTDTSVKEVLTPKKDLFAIDLKGLSAPELAQIVCASKYSRIPVYYVDKENIIGILIVKSFLSAYLSNPHLQIKDYLEKPYIVSPSIRMDEMVDGFRKHHTQLALVYQNGRLVGMLTMEDVLEELVGPISEKLAPEKRIRQ